MTKTLHDKIKKRAFNAENTSYCPELPGIYMFYDTYGTVLYVGKSKSLKNRLKSYLANNLGDKTKELIGKTCSFATVVVNSEIESLLLESFLVKKYMPKYNIQLKDDKTPLYIVIVKDKYPWVATARKSDLKKYEGTIYGPFLSGKNVNLVLSTFRKIFPFATHSLGKRPCFYSHIGLCSPCPNSIENRQDENIKRAMTLNYRKTAGYLKKALNAKSRSLLLEFKREMNKASSNEDFEKAAYYKEKIDAIEYITRPNEAPGGYFENPNLIEDIINLELRSLKKIINNYYNLDSLERIECYDIAHISGNFPTASMVTFINGVADKRLYRHFKIKKESGGSDTDSLLETAKRRVRHLKTWGRPNLIIVDGGKGQVSKFCSVFESYSIPVVGIAKREETLVFLTKSDSGKNEYSQFKLKRGPALNLVQKIRNEAHRFARRYHHFLLKKDLVGLK